MNGETCRPGLRVPAQYSAENRERLKKEHAESGLTKKAFCKEHGINLGTFYAWAKKRKKSLPAKALFAEVEVLLPNGARIGIRHSGSSNELQTSVKSGHFRDMSRKLNAPGERLL